MLALAAFIVVVQPTIRKGTKAYLLIEEIQVAITLGLANREKESDCEIQDPKRGIHRLSAVKLLFRNNR
jgi:hypothetical protein